MATFLPLVQPSATGPRFLPTQPHPIPNPYHASTTCDHAVICVVCGNIFRPTTRSSLNLTEPRLYHHWTHPALIRAKPGFIEWCKQPSTARAFRRNDSKLFDFFTIDQFIGGPAGFFNRSTGQMEVNTQDDEMYLPIHVPCLELALAFCRYQSKFDINFRDVSNGMNSGEPSSIAHLYEIWMKRAWITQSPFRSRLTKPIMEPHKYFGAFVTNDLQLYSHARTSHQWGHMIRVQESDPSLDLLSTARAIVSGVVTLNVGEAEERAREPEVVELRARIAASPPEVRILIDEALEPFDDIGLAELYCTRVYPPEWWLDKLVNGVFIPWLHDLTIRCIRVALDEQNRPDVELNQLDWELLCRQLAQPDPFDRDLGILRCPRLQNRHRIWRLLASARLGHTVIKNI
ncbi:uncharacterized protein GGS22DRAFT_192359 [Annulohypoxylon maeteangense]|uniref:uncharacterized protein n=1 Tax=Annulohypoxylon maeteangense TaxID=1927788 RepID=UPI002007E1E1|nr:uncharacterized protein GGS22DRAFT_192359 [Annulohypoxylon maeteangense]KAI0881271.1 hypothetical protein GGS22DRAFT_192359 [Annulohypoxylon maeteangense]